MKENLDLGLKDKVAIVAGGGSYGDGIGNGRAASILLAEAGAKVLVVDINKKFAQNTVDLIKNNGGNAFAIGADLTSTAECKKVVKEVINKWNRLDILDNNIGIASNTSVVNENERYWDKVMNINLKPMFLMSKYSIPAMINSGNGGVIINISSISATRPKGYTSYSASKGAVISLTKAMAVDHGTDGIRVNCILPGPVYTPMVYQDGMSDKLRKIRKDASLLNVEGDGFDIGKAVVYLSSNWAKYITGQTLIVDGGCSLSYKSRG